MYRLSRRFNLLNARMQSAGAIRFKRPDPDSTVWTKIAIGSSLFLGACASHAYETYAKAFNNPIDSTGMDYDEDGSTLFVNWSGTHQTTTDRYFEPTSSSEVANLVAKSHAENQSLRAVGSGLSPNGIGFASGGGAMINLTQCHNILCVDKEKKQVTVQAGCTVQELLDGIRPYGLTLQNIASIAQQQIGGFLQVGAHGTGATIPPCDMQIVRMKMVTPEHGTINLSEDENRDLFHLARVGLGAFGIVTEVTIQCVPMHELSETTFVLSHEEASSRRDELVGTHRHVRYMWIPFTKSVVVVSSDPVDSTLFAKDDLNSSDLRLPTKSDRVEKIINDMSEEERLLPLSNLVRSVYQENGRTLAEANNAMIGMSFAGIRDLLLAEKPGPLDTEHVRRINEAEALYWKMSTGNRVAMSDDVLAFDCGGQQWVYEICFKTGTVDHGDQRDVSFVRDLLEIIEEEDIPAPSPIEQRWTGRSTSKLSPAFSENEDDVFSWVGIIMYMPTQDPRMRRHVTNEFHKYSEVLDRLCDQYGAVGHWAKIETQLLSRDERLKLQERLAQRYEHIEEWKRARNSVDPKGIMLNDVVVDCFNL